MRHRGFTFIELMVTLAILGVLAAVAVPMLQLSVQREREHELRLGLMQIREAIDAYKRAADQGHIAMKSGESGYPKSLDQLVAGVPDARSPAARNLYFLRRVPRDPFYRDTMVPAADTWGKRSYASPPDEPSEGEDVFDVYSLATGAGLNGIEYRQW